MLLLALSLGKYSLDPVLQLLGLGVLRLDGKGRLCVLEPDGLPPTTEQMAKQSSGFAAAVRGVLLTEARVVLACSSRSQLGVIWIRRSRAQWV